MEDFEEYLEKYKLLPLKEKQSIVYEQLKILSVVCNNYCKEIGANNEMIINKELSEFSSGNYTEDDFAEAVLVLTNSIQNSISDFHLKMSDIINNITK